MTSKNCRHLLYLLRVEMAAHWVGMSVWDYGTFVWYGGGIASTTGTPVFHLFSDFLIPLPALPTDLLFVFLWGSFARRAPPPPPAPAIHRR